MAAAAGRRAGAAAHQPDPHVRPQVPRLRLARQRAALPLPRGLRGADFYAPYIRYSGNRRSLYRRLDRALAGAREAPGLMPGGA